MAGGSRAGAFNDETIGVSSSRPCVLVVLAGSEACEGHYGSRTSAAVRRSSTGHVSPVARVGWSRALVGGV